MAAATSSESQGKTIALVIFVLLTIVSGVLAFYFYDQVDGLSQTAAKAEEDASQARRAENELRKRYESIRNKVFGEQNAGDHDAAMKLIEEDLGSPRLNDERKARKPSYLTFKDALDFTQSELAVADTREAELKDQIAKQKAEIDSLHDKYQSQNQKFQEDRDAKARELKEETDKYQAERNRLEQERMAADDRATKVLNDLQDARNQGESQRRSYERRIAELSAMVERLKEQEQLKAVVQFVKPLGSITELSRASGTTMATINLGSADGLLKGTTFGVYGRDKEGNPYVMPKAGLEVVRIRDAHRAEARLYGEQISDVVLPGDLLYNPIWTKGKKLSVGVVGLVHMDNDDEPDNEEFIRLLRSLGSEVDAVFDLRDLKKKGKMSVDTAWLVVGEMPEEGPNDSQEKKDLAKAINNALIQMRQEAKERGVPIINVRNFLTFMGHQQPQRTIRSGDEAEYMFGKGRDPLPEKGPVPAGAKPDEQGAAGR